MPSDLQLIYMVHGRPQGGGKSRPSPPWEIIKIFSLYGLLLHFLFEGTFFAMFFFLWGPFFTMGGGGPFCYLFPHLGGLCGRPFLGLPPPPPTKISARNSIQLLNMNTSRFEVEREPDYVFH